jgi:hypothetical protein
MEISSLFYSQLHIMDKCYTGESVYASQLDEEGSSFASE